LIWHDDNPRASSRGNLIALALGAVIDYFRWTQLVPMIAAWTFLLIGVGALLLVSFQEQSFALMERGIGVYENVFGPIESAEGMEPAASDTDQGAATTQGNASNGAVTFSDEDFMPVVLRAWAWVALAGYVLGLIRTALFGQWQPWSLGRKLVLAAIAAAAASALMFSAYLFGSEPFNGGLAGWFFLFTGAPLLVWLVSLYSLGVGHLLGQVKGAVSGDGGKQGRVEDGDDPSH